MIRGPNLTSRDDFQEWLDRHQFEYLFKMNNSIDLVTNLYEFGKLIRSLNPVRFSPCEGQHRMWCFSSMIQGLPVATDLLPLQRKMFAQYQDHHQYSFPKWQIHYKKKITFVAGKNDQVDSKVVALCQDYSDDVSQNQEKYIDWNFHSYIVQCSANVGANFEKWGLRKVSAETHWCHGTCSDKDKTGCISANMCIIWDFISDQIDESSTLRMQANLTGGQDKWIATRRDAMLGLAKKKSSGVTLKPPGGGCQHLHVLFCHLKAMSSDKESFYILPDLARAEFGPQRHPGVQDWANNFRNFEFLARNHEICFVAGHFLEARLWIEVKLIGIIRKNGRLWKQEVRAGKELKIPEPTNWDGKPSLDSWHPLPARSKKISMSAIALRTSHSLAKVTESLYCLVVQSFYRWIADEGYDFVIFKDHDDKGKLPGPEEYFGVLLEKKNEDGEVLGKQCNM